MYFTTLRRSWSYTKQYHLRPLKRDKPWHHHLWFTPSPSITMAKISFQIINLHLHSRYMWILLISEPSIKPRHSWKPSYNDGLLSSSLQRCPGQVFICRDYDLSKLITSYALKESPKTNKSCIGIDRSWSRILSKSSIYSNFDLVDPYK